VPVSRLAGSLKVLVALYFAALPNSPLKVASGVSRI
jgi:hypothetical protein